MRINKDCYIFGSKVVLVPYKRKHVKRYHKWMKSPELQHLTASEPLTLDQEFEMQQTWLNSEDKCTFIVVDRAILQAPETEGDEVAAMIGDTNLYINETGPDYKLAEIEVMIAETWARGQRRGWEAALLMLKYGIELLKITDFVAKIKMNNETSINMFKKIGFEEESRSTVFQEITFSKKVNPQFYEWLKEQTYSVKH